MKSHPQEITAPEALHAAHDLSSFDSGVPVLDEWLKKRALSNETTGASRTWVACANGRVVGYYALATGSIAQQDAPGRVRRNMPDPIPVMVLARLAVDRQWQGIGLGSAQLRDAILRTRQAAAIAGIRALLVHAISDEARLFYEHNGFVVSPTQPMTWMIRMADVDHLLNQK